MLCQTTLYFALAYPNGTSLCPCGTEPYSTIRYFAFATLHFTFLSLTVATPNSTARSSPNHRFTKFHFALPSPIFSGIKFVIRIFIRLFITFALLHIQMALVDDVVISVVVFFCVPAVGTGFIVIRSLYLAHKGLRCR